MADKRSSVKVSAPKKAPVRLKAVGYVRVSTEGQADNGYSIQAQQSAIREAAKRNKLRLVAIAKDEGVSGGLEERKGLGKALALLESGEASILLLYRLDRLARDLVIQETILQRLSAKGAQVISVTEPDIDGTDPTRVLVRHVLGAIAQYEKAIIKARMLAGKTAKAAKGGYTGGSPPYGTKAEAGELRTFDEEQAAIKLARRLRRGGRSYREICAALTKAGYRPKRAATWYPMVIKRILEN